MENQFRVLVVDDERDTRRLLCEGITSLGRQYDVMGVPSGEEAQLELTRTLPHLLITDVRLAGISGLELLRKVRARDTALKVIVITGLDNQDIRRQAVESGADAFFTQPVDMVSFLEVVRGFVNGAAPVNAITPPPAEVVESPRPEERFNEIFDEFSRMLDARAAVILDDRGKTRVSMGFGSETDYEMNFVQAVLRSSRAGAALISAPSWGLTANVQVYYGENRIYLLSPLEMGFTLLIALPSTESGALQAASFIKAQAMIKDLDDLIRSSQGFDASRREALSQDPDASAPGEEIDVKFEPDVEPDHNMEAIFSSSAQIDFSRDDVDEFWDNLAASAEKDYYANGNVISYEEARRMGLAPGDDEA